MLPSPAASYLLNAAAFAEICGHALATVLGVRPGGRAEPVLVLVAIMVPCAIQLAGGQTLWVREQGS